MREDCGHVVKDRVLIVILLSQTLAEALHLLLHCAIYPSLMAMLKLPYDTGNCGHPPPVPPCSERSLIMFMLD